MNRMGVQTLQITDDFFRNSEISTRKKFVDLVNSATDSGGTAHIFSSIRMCQENNWDN